MDDFIIVGNYGFGDKARQLIDKTPKLKQIGFHVPIRTVLAEDYFEEFFQINNLGKNLRKLDSIENLETKIINGTLSEYELHKIEEINYFYEAQPLAVRSSAEGDARGTGTYKSTFIENKVEAIAEAVKKVLSSYFSESATAFRKDAKTGEGFGIIIEPIIGQKIGECFAPILSGYGYTSTSKGEGYVNVVPGLGGGVSTRDGERISERTLEKFNGHLGKYVHKIIENITIHAFDRKPKKSALLRIDSWGSISYEDYSGYAYVDVIEERTISKGDVYRCSLNFNDAGLENSSGELDVNMTSLFEMMKRMEDSFGKPQYFEWAMTKEKKGEPKFWITQIADVDKKSSIIKDIINFGDLENLLFMGNTVTGTGIKECDKIAFCWNPGEESALYKFNKTHKDYMLLYSSRLVSEKRYMDYSYFNNASVFLEIQDKQHSGSPISHLGGQLDMTGKLFGVLDYEAENRPQWDKFHAREKNEDGIRIYQGKVKVIADERQDKMIVFALD